MGMLHELLAKIPELEAVQAKMLDETSRLLDKKELLNGHVKILKMHDDDRVAEEAGAGERVSLTTTVPERFKYIGKAIVDRMDAEYQRELANMQAVADLTLPNGKVITAVPVTMLMWLEKELIRIRNLADRIPTLDTTVHWENDTSAELEGVRRTVEPVKANKTEMTKVPVSIAPATKEHKEQVIVVDEQKVVGHYENTRYTGCPTPRQKMVGLSVLDQMIREVKQARARANQVAVPVAAIGEEVYSCFLDAIRTTS